MGDFNSSLPVRTQTNGDVVVFIADATTPTQLTAVDSHGSLSVLLKDASGTAITSTTVNSLDRLNVYLSSEAVNGAAVPFSTVQVGGSDGTDIRALKTDATGRLIIVDSNFPATVDTNYGAVGASTIRTAAQIGNATGAADFNFGAASAQTLRVAALLGNASGLIDYNYGAADGQTVRTAAQIGNATGAADFNYGTVGAQSLRVASQIGNATGAADYNNGATSAQTLRVAANLAVAGANVSSTNPVPVFITSSSPGTLVNMYFTSVNLAAGSSVNLTYTIPAGKTFSAYKFWSSGSGKIRVDIEASPDGSTYSTYWTGFNSTATPNVDINLTQPAEFQDSGTGSTIRFVITNRDLQAFDVFATLTGTYQ